MHVLLYKAELFACAFGFVSKYLCWKKFFVVVFGISESVAAVFGFIVGLAVNYIISTFWVFAKAKVKNRVLDFVIFGVIGVIGLGLTQLIIEPFAVKGMFGEGFLVSNAVFGSLIPVDKYYIIGKLLAVVLVYMWNFFARKFILYRHTDQ